MNIVIFFANVDPISLAACRMAHKINPVAVVVAHRLLGSRIEYFDDVNYSAIAHSREPDIPIRLPSAEA